MKQTLKQLKYVPDEFAAGWDTVLVRMGNQMGEIPVYSLRQVGGVVLKAPPLKTLTVGEVLRLNVTAELNHLVQDDDMFSAKLCRMWCRLIEVVLGPLRREIGGICTSLYVSPPPPPLPPSTPHQTQNTNTQKTRRAVPYLLPPQMLN